MAEAEPLPFPPPLPLRSHTTELPPLPSGLDLLGPDDLLRLSVTGVPALSQDSVRVEADGRVFLRYLGYVQAAGRTPNALARELAQAYESGGYLKRAQVKVDVLAASGRRAYVLGRVASPGAYDLPFHRPLRLTQLLAMAGGVSTSKSDLEADTSAVRLIREVDGTRRTYRLSLQEIVDEGQLAKDAVIVDGDVVYVPPKQELFIFGSVNRPGSFPLADGSRLGIDEALGLAGGFKENADRAGVLLIRRTAEGGVTYGLPPEPAERAKVEITANDTVIVPSRQVSKVYVLGSVGKQGGIPLETGMTVTRAIAQAGGVSRIAAANSTQLIRTKNGKTTVYSVPVGDILSDGETDKDPLLEPGDMIVVPEGFF